MYRGRLCTLYCTDAGNDYSRTNVISIISSTAFYLSHKLQCCRFQIKHSLIAT